jgi:hypothetical protein
LAFCGSSDDEHATRATKIESATDEEKRSTKKDYITRVTKRSQPTKRGR